MDAIDRMEQKALVCPNCGSTNISVQLIDNATVGASQNKVVVVEPKKSKGCLYWIVIGWWWVLISKPISWLFHTFFGGKTRSGVNLSANKIIHKKMAICQNCGHSWKV